MASAKIAKKINKMTLAELPKHHPATVACVGTQKGVSGITKRLLQLGFIEGSTIEVMHHGPFGGDPLVVEVRGSLVALRKREAEYIEVDYE